MMGLHVANRTQNLRIGTGISLAAFYHPLRLAEEVALLDVLSSGRVNWGAGRGFDPTEFKAFGVPPAESGRFRGRLCWQPEERPPDLVRELPAFDDVEALPKPLQQPPSTCGGRVARSPGPAQGYSIMLGPHAHYTHMAQNREITARNRGNATPSRTDIPIYLIAVARHREAEDTHAAAPAGW
jgi:alkanesulfonate monooxygenase SsuD/methylene tetrahydromethanopterin reductase-like flavin-dependent oxidoreductase (luciferase family)